ncbi:MAG: PilN domain-containing protein [Acidobacteriota bacterium]
MLDRWRHMREIRQLTQEKTRLQAIITQVNEFQAKLKELEEKTELIERLTREREGPVRMLDDISAQLPDFVWLTALNQAASTVTIDGMAASYVSIADYIKKLEESEYFRNVELIDARQDREFTAFTIRSEVVTPRAASGTEPALAAGAAVTSR